MEKTFASLLRDFPHAGHRWHNLRRGGGGGGHRRRLPPLPQPPLLRLVGAVAPAGHGSGVRSGVV